jgi:hypothetical protein
MTLYQELLTKPSDFRRQVIVRKLLDLKVLNHGKLFKALLRAYLGGGASMDNIKM